MEHQQFNTRHLTKIDCVAQRSDLVHSCYHGSECIDMGINEFGLLDKYCDCNLGNKLATG